MKTLLTIVLFISLGLCISCDLGLGIHEPTELEKLPPLTTSGENTFGCLVNGEAYIVTSAYNLVAMYQQGVLFIGGENDFKGISTHISLLVEDRIAEGEAFVLNTDTSPKGEYYTQSCFYSTSSKYSGRIEIAYFDTKGHIISGTFEFLATANDACGNDEIMNISDGRFDLQYIP